MPQLQPKRKQATRILEVLMTDDGEATIQVEKDRWEDPEIWGNLLADVVRTLAETYPKKEKLALKKIMRELRDDMKRGPADRE